MNYDVCRTDIEQTEREIKMNDNNYGSNVKHGRQSRSRRTDSVSAVCKHHQTDADGHIPERRQGGCKHVGSEKAGIREGRP